MKQYSILMVDDEEGILSSLKRTLRAEDYEVLTASGGEQAVYVLSQRPVSLIVSDLKMPGMSGFEWLQIVKQRHPEIIRIVLSGLSDIETVMRAINEGEVYRFFTKPWNNDELRVAVRQTLRHFDLLRGASRMLTKLKRQDERLQDLERQYPGITQGAFEEVIEIPEELSDASIEDYLRQVSKAEGG